MTDILPKIDEPAETSRHVSVCCPGDVRREMLFDRRFVRNSRKALKEELCRLLPEREWGKNLEPELPARLPAVLGEIAEKEFYLWYSA